MAAPTALNTLTGGTLAGDVQSLSSLRAKATADPKAAIAQVAKQFESLFMHELLKSMRQSMPDGMFDNEATRLGTEMLDDQWAEKLSGRPGGLAALIAKQLEQRTGQASTDAAKASSGASAASGSSSSAGKASATNSVTTSGLAIGSTLAKAAASAIGSLSSVATAFVKQLEGAASAASAATGIPATFMIAQAGHESGWGKREILCADGSSSHNVFGIKADAKWKGAVAEVTTTEYVDGQPRKMVQKFRAYANYDECFSDYAKLVGSSPRYRDALAAAGDARGFAQGLQKAGYATDPDYALKLERAINVTVRAQRTQG